MEKIAVTNNEIDLMRIIPAKFTNESGDFGLKFSLFNNYSIRYWSLADTTPEETSTDDEITYHNSIKNILPAKIQIKEGEDHRNPFLKVTDIDFTNKIQVPLPICKIEFVDFKGKLFKKKKDRAVIDLGASDTFSPNVVEIYLGPPNFDINKIMWEWRCINLLFMIASVDVIVKGTAHSIDLFYNTISKGVSPVLNMIDSTKCSIIYKLYRDDGIISNRISFYENSDYLEVLATTPISLRIDNRLTEIRPAYFYDLHDISLHNKELASEWEEYFLISSEKIRKMGLHGRGLIIPRQ